MLTEALFFLLRLEKLLIQLSFDERSSDLPATTFFMRSFIWFVSVVFCGASNFVFA